MPEIPALTTKQHDCASFLAAGQTQDRTARLVGISRSTVNRWLKNPAFSQEVERRKQRLIQARELGDRTEVEHDDRSSALAIQAELEAVRQAKKSFREMELMLARKLYQKGIRRLIDLPDEAIPANLIPALLQTAIALKCDGLSEWADELGLDAIADLLGGGETA